MKDEWTDAYSLIMPMLGLMMSAVGLSFSLLMLRQSQAQEVGGLEPPAGIAVEVPRVRYSDHQVFIEVRDPGEWRELREFVQPGNLYLNRIISEVIYG